MARLIIVSITVLIAAAIFELGGDYLIWQWLKERRPFIVGLCGGLVLFIYGVTQTLQPTHFSRAYAAYGGIFIVASMIWGFVADKKRPDRLDIVGAGLALAGGAVMLYAPR